MICEWKLYLNQSTQEIVINIEKRDLHLMALEGKIGQQQERRTDELEQLNAAKEKKNEIQSEIDEKLERQEAKVQKIKGKVTKMNDENEQLTDKLNQKKQESIVKQDKIQELKDAIAAMENTMATMEDELELKHEDLDAIKKHMNIYGSGGQHNTDRSSFLVRGGQIGAITNEPNSALPRLSRLTDHSERDDEFCSEAGDSPKSVRPDKSGDLNTLSQSSDKWDKGNKRSGSIIVDKERRQTRVDTKGKRDNKGRKTDAACCNDGCTLF